MSTKTLQERLRADQMNARRAQDRFTITLLGTTLSEVQNRRIELGRQVSDEDVVAVLGKAIKRRAEAAEAMRAGGRVDLAEKEEAEAVVLKAYMPASLSEAEVRGMVQEAIAAGAARMGDVMKVVSPRVRGRFDGKLLSGIVQTMLA
jgi:uncharacterized protein